MARHQFDEISRCLALDDHDDRQTNLDTWPKETSEERKRLFQALKANPLYRINKIWDTVLHNCQCLYNLRREIAVDEATVSYKGGRLGLTSICDPLGCDIPMLTKEKIWKGKFAELSALLSSERPVKSKQQQRWSFSTQGQNIIAQQAVEEEGKEIKGIFSWTNAFLILASVFIEKHAGRAQKLLKYAANIRKFAQFSVAQV